MEQLRTPQRDHLEIEIGSDRSFGFIFAAAFSVVALSPLLRGGGIRWWAVALSGGFLVAALVMPRVLRRPKMLWFRFGMALHRIVSPIVMALVFFIGIAPIGVTARLLGNDFLRLRRKPGTRSYWLERRPPGPDAESMRHQF